MTANDDNEGERGWEDDVPWWYPTREIVLGKSRHVVFAAKSLVVGTQWPQARLAEHRVGGTNHQSCKACDMNEKGTLLHRHCEYPK